jgi:acetyl-CoA carboxylase alpha subunit
MSAYDSVLAVAKTYMGPAAESFLSRQCQVGLKTEAANLTKAQFKDLAAWVEVSACRFIDRPKAEEMSKRIAAL